MPDLPDISKTEAAIVALTNEFRRSEKLADVMPNVELHTTARLYAEYLAKTGGFAHEADGRKPADRAKAVGYRFCTIAENLALNLDSRGFETAALARQAIDGWKKSSGHRQNMVLPHVTEIGVGVARAPDANPKYISVQLFGRPDSYKYQFRIENRTGVAATYSIQGKTHSLEPRVIATHSACEPAEIAFERSGSWIGGAKLETHFAARDGARYLLTMGADGRVRVDVVAGVPR